MMKLACAAALVLTVGVAGSVDVEDPTVMAGPPRADARVARIEQGLLPPILFKGEARTGLALKERMARHEAPGVSLAVVDGGVVAWARGWGVVRNGETAPVTADTLFQAGSISKTVTALLTLRLVGQGRLALDDPVNARLKSWKLPDSGAGGEQPVTIRHLLTHSAGLSPAVYLGVEPAGSIPTVLDLLQGKGQDSLSPVARIEPPGVRFSYSNPGFAILQHLLVDVTGTPFDRLAAAELFAPLGLTSTTFTPGPAAPLLELAAWGHLRGGEAIASKGLVVPAAVGGLWTTPSDLARLLAALATSCRGLPGGVIPRALAHQALEALVESQGLLAPVEGSGAARRLVQMGAMPGFTAYLVVYPERGQGAVVMINAGGRSGDLARELARAVAVEYGWPGYLTEYERVPLPPRAAEELVGQYEFDNPAYPKIQVTAKDGHLYWADRDVQAVAGGSFVVEDAGIEVEFVRDAGGAVVAADYRPPGMRKVRVKRTR